MGRHERAEERPHDCFDVARSFSFSSRRLSFNDFGV